MRQVLVVSLLMMLSGCALMQQNQKASTNDKGTTVVDAVEGDLSKKEPETKNTSMTDTLRTRKDAVQDDPAWAPINPQKQPEHYVAETGSLFNQASESSLYDDSKPRRIGDIITVSLDEKTKAAKSADSDLSKKNDSSMDPLNVGGQELKFGQYNLSYALKNGNKFSGSAQANQSNSISGSISVQVVEVLANGNLVIRGEKWLTLNSGDEYVRLSGVIRPQDISADNTIESTRISNARIQYSGTGTNQDMQEPGFLARFFNVAL